MLLAFGSAAYGAVPLAKPYAEQSEKADSLSGKENSKVRVIVEMAADSAMEKAKKDGRDYRSLSSKQQETYDENALKAQAEVKTQMKKALSSAEYKNEFTTIFNGFSAVINAKDVQNIAELKGVKQVHIANEYERPEISPDMNYSGELIQKDLAWEDYGYKGEGLVIGIIDSGMDLAHKDMVISEGTETALTAEEVEALSEEHGLKGAYLTEKMPYGYNYFDKNDNVIDVGEGASHGMHVAGTVAANGDLENGGIKGVAPEAQLLALKVFGSDPQISTTYSDIFIKAIDDAIKLGADGLNLSLGATAGFTNPADPEQQAVKRAVDNGIAVAISAGNSAHFGDPFYPFASNPDYGLTGSPSTTMEALTVAALDNLYVDSAALTPYFDGEAQSSAPYSVANDQDPFDFVQDTYELVDAGLGYEEDFNGIDVAGKYALIQRGEIDFVSKMLNAQYAGAAGAIIYNNTDGFVSMATDPEITIPQLFMVKSEGDKLANALENGVAVEIAFTGEMVTQPNPTGGSMSSFTSWGLTPSLDFKPEITAPGGSIYSTDNDNGYAVMGGTSMAAPHVAGGSALVMQRIEDENLASKEDRVQLVKSILMSTSYPVLDPNGLKVSPRRQGAGLMQLHAALSTPSIVKAEDGTSAVALKEIENNVATFDITVQNLSEDQVSYDVALNAQTDAVSDIFVAPNLIFGQEITGAVLTVDGEETNTVTVDANSEEVVSLEVDLSEATVFVDDAEVSAAEAFTNGYFAEGFVTFTDPEDVNPMLSIPYVGFNGDWTQAPIFDLPVWDEMKYYDYTTVRAVEREWDYAYPIGQDWFSEDGTTDPEKIAFSPNGDMMQDEVLPVVSLLRNVKELKVNVLDENENFLRTIRTEGELRKNYIDGENEEGATYMPGWAWDGKVNGKTVKDGQYYFEVRAKIDFPGAEWQTILLPIKVDNEKPEVEATFDFDSQTLTFNTEDNLGVQYVDVLVDGMSVIDFYLTPEDDVYEFTKRVKEGQTVQVMVGDYAGNVVTETVLEGEDSEGPQIFLDSPEFFGTYQWRDIFVSGFVTDGNEVSDIKVNGEDVEKFEFDANNKYFFHRIIFEKDGVHDIRVSATDKKGNEISIIRTVIVDSEAPELTLTSDKPDSIVEEAAENPVVSLSLKDNFDDVKVRMNGNEIYSSEPTAELKMNPLKDVIENIELPLEDGVNRFVFTAEDAAGNVGTLRDLIIYKEGPDAPAKDLTDIDSSNVDQFIKDANNGFIEVPAAPETNGLTRHSIMLTEDALSALSKSKNGIKLIGEEVVYSVEAKDLEKYKNEETLFLYAVNYDSQEEIQHKDSLVPIYGLFAETADGEMDLGLPFKASFDLKGKKVSDWRKVSAQLYDYDNSVWKYAGGVKKDQWFTAEFNGTGRVTITERDVTFGDIQNSWAKDQIEVLASIGVTTGKTPDTFMPNGQLTRTEFAVLLTRALQLPTEDYRGEFSDIPASHWAAAEIEAAQKAGIVNGSLDGTFKPGNKITREQMAAMIMRAVKYVNPYLVPPTDFAQNYTDHKSIDGYAEEAVYQAEQLGIMTGKKDGRFAPKDYSTRAQMAVVLQRMIETLNKYSYNQ